MKTIDDYIDAALLHTDIPSERQLSMRLGLSAVSLSNYRTKKAWPSDATMMRLAALAGVAESEALVDLNYWRTKSPEARSVYERLAAQLKGAAVAGALLLALFAPASSDARTDGAQPATGVYRATYYAILT